MSKHWLPLSVWPDGQFHEPTDAVCVSVCRQDPPLTDHPEGQLYEAMLAAAELLVVVTQLLPLSVAPEGQEKLAIVAGEESPPIVRQLLPLSVVPEGQVKFGVAELVEVVVQ